MTNEVLKQKLILASASPRRKMILEMCGFLPEVKVSNVEENTDKTDPAQIVMELAAQKCGDVAKDVEDGFILGADTMVAIGTQILGKPKDRDEAFCMLRSLSGNMHQVFTGLKLIHKKQGRVIAEKNLAVMTQVHVVPMSDGEIEAYIETGEPFDKAGAYGVQGSFAIYVDQIFGDYLNVVGLPVYAVYQKMKEMLDEENK